MILLFLVLIRINLPLMILFSDIVSLCDKEVIDNSSIACSKSAAMLASDGIDNATLDRVNTRLSGVSMDTDDPIVNEHRNHSMCFEDGQSSEFSSVDFQINNLKFGYR